MQQSDPHATARAIYAAYLVRAEVLARRRAYAERVVAATSGTGPTPVEPLATLGARGGPLVCDICHKPMLLEGSAYNRVDADEAWRRNPQRGWVSWISGGMVVRVEGNRTLRIYHGYPGRSGCVQLADKQYRAARAAFVERPDLMDVLDQLTAYFKAELPDKANDAVLNEIYQVMFRYDPGLGINSPE